MWMFLRAQIVVELGGDRVGLGDLLALEARALEHVEKVGVAAHVELRGALEPDSAVTHEPGENAMDDGGPDLRLDVVADDRKASLLEPLLPVLLAGDEDRDTVDETATGLEDLLHIPLGGHLAADRQVVHHDVGLGVFENAHDIGGRAGRLLDDLRQVLAQTIMRHAPVDLDSQLRDVGELGGAVATAPNGLRQVLAHLGLVDIDGTGELDVGDVIPAEVHVHEAGNELIRLGVAVEMHALDEGRRAVPHSDYGNPYFIAQRILPAPFACAVGGMCGPRAGSP